MKPFYKAKIAFNRALSLNGLLLSTQIWPHMGKEAGERKRKGGGWGKPAFSDFFIF